MRLLRTEGVTINQTTAMNTKTTVGVGGSEGWKGFDIEYVDLLANTLALYL